MSIVKERTDLVGELGGLELEPLHHALLLVAQRDRRLARAGANFLDLGSGL